MCVHAVSRFDTAMAYCQLGGLNMPEPSRERRFTKLPGKSRVSGTSGPASDLPELLSVDEAAHILSISPYTLYYWTSAKKIPHYRIGKRVMFAKCDLAAWVASRRIKAA